MGNGSFVPRGRAEGHYDEEATGWTIIGVGPSLALWFVAAAAMLCVLVVIVAVWAARTEVERRPAPDPVQRRADHVSLRPVLLDVDGDAFVLDGLLDIGERTSGVPATLVLRVPESAPLVSMTRHLLDRWTEDGNDVGVDLSKADQPRPSVALSKGDSLVRLSLVRMSPPLKLRRNVTHR